MRPPFVSLVFIAILSSSELLAASARSGAGAGAAAAPTARVTPSGRTRNNANGER